MSNPSDEEQYEFAEYMPDTAGDDADTGGSEEEHGSDLPPGLKAIVALGFLGVVAAVVVGATSYLAGETRLAAAILVLAAVQAVVLVGLLARDRRAYDAALLLFCFNAVSNVGLGNVPGAAISVAIVAYLLRNGSLFR